MYILIIVAHCLTFRCVAIGAYSGIAGGMGAARVQISARCGRLKLLRSLPVKLLKTRKADEQPLCKRDISLTKASLLSPFFVFFQYYVSTAYEYIYVIKSFWGAPPKKNQK